jgi:hypothetical protein
MAVSATDQEVTPKLLFLGFDANDPMSYFQIAKRLDFAVRRDLLPHKQAKLYPWPALPSSAPTSSS